MRSLNSLISVSAAAKLRATAAVCAAAVSAIAATSVASYAQQGTPNISYYGPSIPANFSDWVARNFVVTAGNPNDPVYATMKGTGYDGVAALFVQRTDGNFLCTGALLSGTFNVLTAAHCLANTSGQNITLGVTAVFFTPGQPVTTRELITSNATHVNPLYTGEVIDAHDVAVVSLGSAPSNAVFASGYKLFGGNPFQGAEFVGSGTTGTGATGGDPTTGGFTLADRRRALNLIDFTWSDPGFGGFFDGFFGSADPTTLVADFDSGLDANDSSCIITGFFCDLGFGRFEGILGPGDSGGPLFINGQIAGVASYGLTFGKSFGDIDNKLNETYGEFAGWTSTEYNEDWIAPYAVPVPEPATFALVGVGLAVVFGVNKKRRRHS